MLALPSLLFVVFIAMLSGFAATVATVAWVVPPFYTDQILSRFDGGRNTGTQTPDPSFVLATRQRMIGIFDTTKIGSAQVYPESAFVGYSAILSSDGWAVASDLLYRPGKERQWEGIDNQGTRHAVERVVADPAAGVVYMKFAGDGFRVFSFPDWRTISYGLPLWQVDATHAFSQASAVPRLVTLGESKRKTSDPSFSIWRGEYLYQLGPGVFPGSLLISQNGEFVGFSDKLGNLVPGWLVAGQLSSVLSERPIRYGTTQIEGYMADGVLAEDGVKLLSGFYVTKENSDVLERGDLLLRFGGEAITPAHLSRYLLLSPGGIPATILRKGEETVVNLGGA